MQLKKDYYLNTCHTFASSISSILFQFLFKVQYMKNVLHLLFLAVFACTTLLFSACGSTKNDPTPQTGVLNGQINPAAAVTTVTATDAANKTTTATPNASGAYSFSGLAAGTYTLSFTPASGYAAPATQSVTITAGGTTTATPVTATTSTGGSASFTVGGTTTTASLVLGNLQATNLSITMASATGRSVVFTLEGFAGTAGTFSLANQLFTSTQLIYSEPVGTTSAQQWTTAGFLSNNQGSGNVVITSIGTNPRRASGTFTATAYPATSASTGTRVITGTFTNVNY